MTGEKTLGFVGLGNMGSPMAGRLIAAGHHVVVYDSRPAAVDDAAALGAERAASVREVADRADTVLASLPTPEVSRAVVTEVAEGAGVRTFVDLSTIGQLTAEENARVLGEHGVTAFDSPVSGGVAGAENGTLALMVSGPRAGYDGVAPVLEVLGRPIFVGETPGAGQTMKLVNNLMAATTLAATAEVMVMGVKAGLDAAVMIDVLNAGSGGTHASRDKFPRAVLPRTFDYGFATGLMVKDVRLYLQEAETLGALTPIASAVRALWEQVLAQHGPDADFTTVVKPFEDAAGVVVEGH
ncbi:beta-hydroxyacid dehydrogenase, 3-hydroxyisobutyrate dehydrogenase [Mycolicibacterium chubuense NBB4]|uniref:Beta-hydroxyacid dehydrogenase, 3-hydroxyisobutyrate dehydrogenase n=1 Tax=Mycolicibacterium chubuense (strain NBB4) TaxID=710421 RepID=I4BEK6_MYCCN|nr:NAD(P)-dependent oxidoreductase [Mycolicibacterium chubuense]AFM15713.1 beta-hydroxyacid dehydrogenase, 3-hydroxyisobutyrate dehydrogenase [Mycolicibacterium chubuense NBB4]